MRIRAASTPRLGCVLSQLVGGRLVLVALPCLPSPTRTPGSPQRAAPNDGIGVGWGSRPREHSDSRAQQWGSSRRRVSGCFPRLHRVGRWSPHVRVVRGPGGRDWHLNRSRLHTHVVGPTSSPLGRHGLQRGANYDSRRRGLQGPGCVPPGTFACGLMANGTLGHYSR